MSVRKAREPAPKIALGRKIELSDNVSGVLQVFFLKKNVKMKKTCTQCDRDTMVPRTQTKIDTHYDTHTHRHGGSCTNAMVHTQRHAHTMIHTHTQRRGAGTNTMVHMVHTHSYTYFMIHTHTAM